MHLRCVALVLCVLKKKEKKRKIKYNCLMIWLHNERHATLSPAQIAVADLTFLMAYAHICADSNNMLQIKHHCYSFPLYASRYYHSPSISLLFSTITVFILASYRKEKKSHGQSKKMWRVGHHLPQPLIILRSAQVREKFNWWV